MPPGRRPAAGGEHLQAVSRLRWTLRPRLNESRADGYVSAAQPNRILERHPRSLPDIIEALRPLCGDRRRGDSQPQKDFCVSLLNPVTVGLAAYKAVEIRLGAGPP